MNIEGKTEFPATVEAAMREFDKRAATEPV
jgi:hypothetical protein